VLAIAQHVRVVVEQGQTWSDRTVPANRDAPAFDERTEAARRGIDELTGDDPLAGVEHQLAQGLPDGGRPIDARKDTSGWTRDAVGSPW